MAFDRLDTNAIPVGVDAPNAPLGLWASYRAARRNVLELIPTAAYEKNVIADEIRGRWIMLLDPPAIDRVLRVREAQYPKSAILLRLMTPREGRNLIATEGETWHRQRRALSTPFTPRAIRSAGPIIENAARQGVKHLSGSDTPTDVFPVMARVSCDVMCDIALNGREAIDRDALRRSVEAYVAGLGRVSLFDILGVPNWVPRPAAIFDRSRKQMDDLADEIAAARRARGSAKAETLLDLLVEAEERGDLDALEVRNNLLGFLFAGHETTALALTWALYLLSMDQSAQARARDEVATIYGSNRPSVEGIPKLKYLKQVLQETMRLYPPAGFLTRTARVDDVLAGHPVRAGATVILPVYALHRHALLWDRPFHFNPDRFAPDLASQFPRGSYLPFGDGPRICIGAAMAMTEATLILATLLQSLEFALPDGFSPEPVMWFTLRPQTGMPLIVRRLAATKTT